MTNTCRLGAGASCGWNIIQSFITKSGRQISWLIPRPFVTISPPSTIGRIAPYVIELGHTLEPLGEVAHYESNKVRGCVSQVWLEREARRSADGQAIRHYRGDSDLQLALSAHVG